MQNSEIITLEQILWCFDETQYEARHNPENIIYRIFQENKTIEDAVKKSNSLLSDGYDLYMIYNAVQGKLGLFRIKDEIKSRREKIFELIATAACALLGCVYGAQFLGDLTGMIAATVSVMAIPRVLYTVRDTVELCKTHSPSYRKQLEGVNAFLEKELRLEAKEVVYNASWGCYYSIVDFKTVIPKKVSIKQVVHIEKYEFEEDGKILIVQVENGKPYNIWVSEPMSTFPVSLSQNEIEAFGAMVHQYLRFYSKDNEIVQLH